MQCFVLGKLCMQFKCKHRPAICLGSGCVNCFNCKMWLFVPD